MDVVYNRYTHEQTKYDRQHGATETLRKQTYQAVVYLILTDLSVLCSHNYIIYLEGPPCHLPCAVVWLFRACVLPATRSMNSAYVGPSRLELSSTIHTPGITISLTYPIAETPQDFHVSWSKH